MKTKTILDTKVVVRHNQSGEIKVYSPILDEETIYNDVTVDTMLRNQLGDQLIKLHS